MSNGWTVEVIRWHDGNIRLVFWDSLHGEDEIIVLQDGAAFKEEFVDGVGDTQETLVDLVEFFEGLVEKLEQRKDT